MVRRGELTDRAWERIAPLLPENGGRGKQWKDHRQVVNGVLWKLRTGAPVVRAHQHAAGARRRPSGRDQKGG